MPAGAPTHIVLIGGGHAHVHVLDLLARQAGIRVTLVSRERQTPYSGMLPGVIAGLYSAQQAHIDLPRLAASTGTAFIHGEAVALDRAGRRVVLKDGAEIGYDLLSIDVGAAPSLDSIPGAREYAIAVKPIGTFLEKLEGLISTKLEGRDPRRIAMIGGGAGGVELLLSLFSRITRGASPDYDFMLVTGGEILSSHNTRVRSAFRRVLREKKIVLHEHSEVSEIRAGEIVLRNGTSLASDTILVATAAAPPALLARTGLALDGKGFLATGETLQSMNDPNIFAAGDCASIEGAPREKAGVYAVRAGPPLGRNLLLRAKGEALAGWIPQERHLALISTGERYAIASRGWFKCEGGWVWRIKDWIDRRWVGTYQR